MVTVCKVARWIEHNFPLLCICDGLPLINLLVCTYGGVHPGRIDQTSPTEFITYRTRTRRPGVCLSGLFTRLFLFHTHKKAGVPEKKTFQAILERGFPARLPTNILLTSVNSTPCIKPEQQLCIRRVTSNGTALQCVQVTYSPCSSTWRLGSKLPEIGLASLWGMVLSA